MLPVYRWCLCGMGALWSCAAWAQAATAQPEIDESKIPEWVKRQARSPYKVIIDSSPVRARPVAPKEDAGGKTAAKKTPVKTTVPIVAEPEKAAPALAANTAAAPPVAAPPVAEPPLLAASAAAETAAAPQPPAEITLAPIVAAVALPARVVVAEPPPLTLLKRIEPVLSADLLDNRLNTANVVAAFTVTAGGEVTNLSIASTTDSRLNRAVLRALRAWRYAPIPEPREHMVSFVFATE